MRRWQKRIRDRRRARPRGWGPYWLTAGHAPPGIAESRPLSRRAAPSSSRCSESPPSHFHSLPALHCFSFFFYFESLLFTRMTIKTPAILFRELLANLLNYLSQWLNNSVIEDTKGLSWGNGQKKRFIKDYKCSDFSIECRRTAVKLVMLVSTTGSSQFTRASRHVCIIPCTWKKLSLTVSVCGWGIAMTTVHSIPVCLEYLVPIMPVMGRC